jgi:hypothetical protein
LLREKHVYLFSNGNVKISNRKYSAIDNDFCIVFDQNAEIVEVKDDETIQSLAFSFVNINRLKTLYGPRTIDFIGVAH